MKPIHLSWLIAIMFSIALTIIYAIKQTGIVPLLCFEGVVILAFVVCPILFRRHEKKQYNGGICPKCGHTLRHFDSCFCGDEGYKCDNCGNTFWTSWFLPAEGDK